MMMSTLENQALMECAYERFLHLIDSNTDVELLIYEHILAPEYHYEVAKEGVWIGQRVDLEGLFEELWTRDAELCLHDAFEALKRYCEVNK
jgi:hypothetical protein